MSRPLTIVADDYGIGRDTSRGILDLALAGRITGTVMIVNCDDAEQASREWLDEAPPADLGWHPNLTLDRPILPAREVPSLVRPDGTFWPLSKFLARACLGKILETEVAAEWQAQYRRFVQLIGRPPELVNSHQHVSLFPPCDSALLDVLRQANARPYLRRVVERAPLIAKIPGARIKRTVLSLLGRRAARRAAANGLPGCDWLAGVTDHAYVADERFWDRWLGNIGSSGSVEICCHPGNRDESLVGRDCDTGDGLLRRPRESVLLNLPSFSQACARSGLVPVRPSTISKTLAGGP